MEELLFRSKHTHIRRICRNGNRLCNKCNPQGPTDIWRIIVQAFVGHRTSEIAVKCQAREGSPRLKEFAGARSAISCERTRLNRAQAQNHACSTQMSLRKICVTIIDLNGQGERGNESFLLATKERWRNASERISAES